MNCVCSFARGYPGLLSLVVLASFQLDEAVSLKLIPGRHEGRHEEQPDVDELMQGAYDWLTNLGSPAALVAGAVLATNWGSLELRQQDSRWCRLGRKLSKMLFLSAFAMEVMCIFTTTVTGTMLKSRPAQDLHVISSDSDTEATPLSFLRDNFEFEYLTARITFLQGLLNWLAAIALELATDSIDGGSTAASRKMNRFMAAAHTTSILLMLSFYNKHMTFYENYWGMLIHWVTVTISRLVWCWPPRPLAALFVPSFLWSTYLGFVAFMDDGSIDEEGDKVEQEKTGYKTE